MAPIPMFVLNISLPDPMREWIDTQIKGGEYANASDYIRDLIRHDQERRRMLQAVIREGSESGRSPRKAKDAMAAAKRKLGSF